MPSTRQAEGTSEACHKWGRESLDCTEGQHGRIYDRRPRRVEESHVERSDKRENTKNGEYSTSQRHVHRHMWYQTVRMMKESVSVKEGKGYESREG